MKKIRFTSLHGTTLSGDIQKEIKVQNDRVYIVNKLHKLYAIVDGYSILEMPDDTDQLEFNKQILNEL